MKKIHTIILTLLVLVSGRVFPQTTTDYFNKASQVPIMTPDAASFSKFVEFPVSLYNGVPNISVPLYTIQSGDISVPITLSYHAGGIRVSEEASWVGLGWNLDVGGMISRQVNGQDDWAQPTYDYFGAIFPQAPGYNEYNGPMAIYGACSGIYDSLGNPAQTSTGNNLVNLVNYGEGEPDTYVYNFGQFSGKFIQTNKVHDFERSNIIFTVLFDSSITAKTPDGYLYEFNDVETGTVGSNPYAVTGYHLSRITSPKGKVVNFTYQYLYNQRTVDTYSEVFSTSTAVNAGATGSGDPGTLSQKIQANSSNPVYLARIDFDEGYINFVRATRKDMAGLRLERMDINYSDGTLLKSFNFDQSYFVGASDNYYTKPTITNPDPTSSMYPDSLSKMRLRLDAVVETGNDPSLQPKQYSFEYYDSGIYTLPYKTSWAVDYWGYYNGATGNSNTTFIPQSQGFQLSSPHANINNYPGANREPNGASMVAGTLKKMTYPTKGWTEYSYSAHQFTNVSNAPVKTGLVVAASATDIGSGTQEATFTLASPRSVNISVSLFCDCISNYCLCSVPPTVWDCGGLQQQGYSSSVLYAELRRLNPLTGTYDFIDWDHTWDGSDIQPGNCNSDNLGKNGIFNVTDELDAGTYKIIANYPDNKAPGSLGDRMAVIQVSYEKTYHDPVMTAGGLRISQIKHHDDEQNTDLVSTYEYHNGTLMNFPAFYWKKLHYEQDANFNPNEPTYWAYSDEYLYGNSVIPISTSAHGSIVGYDTVIERRVNGSASDGWTEYVYENTADNIPYGQPSNMGIAVSPYAPGEPCATHLKNGFLNESTIFDGNGNPLKKTVNSPSVLLGESFWSFKKDVWNINSFLYDQPCNNLQVLSCMFYFYPIQMGKVVPSQSVEYSYSSGNELATTTTFSYNPVGDMSSRQTVGSDERTATTEYKYLSDYTATSGWLKDLSNLNKRNEPLEVYTKINGNVVGGTFVKYATINGKTLPSEVYEIQTSTPANIASTAPNAILPLGLKLKGTIVNDANGNISYAKATDNIVTSYIWGYNNTFPIAVVQNALPTQIYHTSFEDLTSNFSTTVKTGTKSYNGATPFTVPLPSAGTYKLTYWMNAGGGWQYTETTMSAPKSIGGAGVLIDEVRVYPIGAQMTTYTYDVLLGLTSKSDQNSVKTSYQYDGLGRLRTITDNNDNILKEFEYHYKN